MVTEMAPIYIYLYVSTLFEETKKKIKRIDKKNVEQDRNNNEYKI